MQHREAALGQGLVRVLLLWEAVCCRAAAALALLLGVGRGDGEQGDLVAVFARVAAVLFASGEVAYLGDRQAQPVPCMSCEAWVLPPGPIHRSGCCSMGVVRAGDKLR